RPEFKLKYFVISIDTCPRCKADIMDDEKPGRQRLFAALAKFNNSDCVYVAADAARLLRVRGTLARSRACPKGFWLPHRCAAVPPKMLLKQHHCPLRLLPPFSAKPGLHQPMQ